MKTALTIALSLALSSCTVPRASAFDNGQLNEKGRSPEESPILWRQSLGNGSRSNRTILAVVEGVPQYMLAFDNGQYQNIDPKVRDWFKSVRSPNGVPCCDIADGRRTDYEMRPDGYYVPLNGGWQRVPDEVVIHNAGNPVGEAVVWYMADRKTIRCFVPGADY